MLQNKRVGGIINNYLIRIGKAFLVYFPEIEAMNCCNDWVPKPFPTQVVYNFFFFAFSKIEGTPSQIVS